MLVAILIVLVLLLVGLRTGYVSIAHWRWWSYVWQTRKDKGDGAVCGLFKNLPHIMPGRWGFWILGFEVGSRNPRNKIGVWLKNHGLWPW